MFLSECHAHLHLPSTGLPFFIFFFFFHELRKLMFAWCRRRVRASTSKQARCIVIFIREASVSAPPVSNPIQSTSDSREWDGKRNSGRRGRGRCTPHTKQILFLAFSVPQRNVRGAMLRVVAFFFRGLTFISAEQHWSGSKGFIC